MTWHHLFIERVIGQDICKHDQAKVFTCIMSLVTGSVMTFSSSGASSPGCSLKTLTSHWDRWVMTPLATSKGNSTSTDSQLKQSWTVAPAKALPRVAVINSVHQGHSASGWSSTLNNSLLIRFLQLQFSRYEWDDEHVCFDCDVVYCKMLA